MKITCEHCNEKTIEIGEDEICSNCGGSIFQSPEEFIRQKIIDDDKKMAITLARDYANYVDAYNKGIKDVISDIETYKLMLAWNDYPKKQVCVDLVRQIKARLK